MQDCNSPTPTRLLIDELLALERQCADLRNRIGLSLDPIDMTIELRRETDGRFLATIVAPGVLHGVEDYGSTPQEACCKALDLLSDVDESAMLTGK